MQVVYCRTLQHASGRLLAVCVRPDPAMGRGGIGGDARSGVALCCTEVEELLL